MRVGLRVGVASGAATARFGVGVRVGMEVAVATIGHGSVADTSKMARPHRTASARPRIIKHTASAIWKDAKWESRIVRSDTWKMTRVGLISMFLSGESHLISQKP